MILTLDRLGFGYHHGYLLGYVPVDPGFLPAYSMT
jgi:hypothetical protein